MVKPLFSGSRSDNAGFVAELVDKLGDVFDLDASLAGGREERMIPVGQFG
jgi:hypothetical protein